MNDNKNMTPSITIYEYETHLKLKTVSIAFPRLFRKGELILLDDQEYFMVGTPVLLGKVTQKNVPDGSPLEKYHPIFMGEEIFVSKNNYYIAKPSTGLIRLGRTIPWDSHPIWGETTNGSCETGDDSV